MHRLPMGPDEFRALVGWLSLVAEYKLPERDDVMAFAMRECHDDLLALGTRLLGPPWGAN